MNKITAEKGITFIELIVAALILGASAAALMAAYTAAKSVMDESIQRFQALSMAMSVAEDLRSKVKYGDNVGGESFFPGTHDVTTTYSYGGLRNCTVGYNVTEVPVGNPAYRQVTIRVGWER